MNNKIRVGFGIALLTFAVSCVKLIEPTPSFAPSTVAFSASTSAAAVATAAADSTKAALTVSWNDPKFAVGLKNSKFTVMVGKAGANFAAFSTKEFTNALSGDLTGKDLNGMALKLGGVIGQPVALELMVVASQQNNNEPKKSTVLPLSVTPFSGFGLVSSTAAITPVPATPDIIGATFTWNVAFNGFSGIKTYEIQHAKAGTDFAAPTIITVTGFSRAFTHLQLNDIALGYGNAPSVAGNVEFRVKATNELGATTFSNTSVLSITPYIAINSIGMIGDATPGSWGIDTDMYRPDLAGKPSDWSVIIYLISGNKIVFRQDDDWANKWGVGGKGGGDITFSEPTGFYKTDLNVATGVYSFTAVTVPTVSSMSIIGDATPNGWGDDTNLTVNPTNPNIYNGIVQLTAGSLKFRKTGDWGINFGGPGADDAAVNFPSAWGKVGGGNIRINTAGTYFAQINIATGEYFFGQTNRSTPYADIGIIGNSTPGGWDNDTDLIKNPSNPFKWSGKITLAGSPNEAKFRANNGWGVNWGNNTFPNGVGTDNGPNVPIASAGAYQITFHTGTGEYTFSK